VIDWLLDSDPAIRWQVMRDLLGAPEAEWSAERARVETEGWGARLLACADEDGQWAGGAFIPRGFTEREWQAEGQPWTATAHVLDLLREFGVNPASERVRRMVALIGANARWEHDDEPFWAGEVEECINGRTVANGAYFGVDVSAIVARLAGERLSDGGWNCWREHGSVRSSFDSTINVLEGLLAYEQATGVGVPARIRGEEYLLERRLSRRLSTGEPAAARFLEFTHPSRWRYDVLRALDYFRAADRRDPRLEEAVRYVRSRRRPDGTWTLDRRLPGRVWFELEDGEGRPSRWITLRALRVLRWWDGT
jgi:hypothetical protein